MRTDIRLGKRPKRSDLRTLQFRNYLSPSTVQLLPPPMRQDWVTAIPVWPMYENDTLGDCVIAAAAHSIGQRSYLATKNEIILTPGAILQGYEDVGQYDPNAALNPDGSNPTDNGCDMLTALKYWKKTGFGANKILAYVEIDPKNLKEVEQAIWIFGNAFAGFALPFVVQGLDYWPGPPTVQDGDWEAGSWGGHCVPLCSYDQRAFCCVTWGSKLDMDRAFVPAYCDECYATISQEWLDQNGIAVSGFNLAQLQTDLAAL